MDYGRGNAGFAGSISLMSRRVIMPIAVLAYLGFPQGPAVILKPKIKQDWNKW